MIADGNAAYHLVARLELNTKSPAHHVKLCSQLYQLTAPLARPTTEDRRGSVSWSPRGIGRWRRI